jgi:hypothetical protein
MRSSKSRSRSKQNRPRTLGNIINRVFDSSGPEGKVRGTPQQVIEKYQQLARDAQLSNDRVAAENFSQHAEHYTRLLGEAQREMVAEQEARQQQFSQNGGQNGNHNGGQNGNQNGGQAGGQNGNQNGNPNNNRERDNRDRDQRDSRDNRQWRDDRAMDAGSGEQPDIPASVAFAVDDEIGLVETPEALVDAPPRREDRPRRNDRNEGREGNPRHRNRDDNRGDRGPRQTDAPAPAEPAPQPTAMAQPQPPVVAQPQSAPAPEATASGTPAPAADPVSESPKPRRPRAPRKPKEAGATDAEGGDPREAAE